MASRYVPSNSTFINPYNFVSVNYRSKSEGKLPGAEEALLTGVIDCTMYARTPLAIPDANNGEADKDITGHKCFPFMRDPEGNPMIPGSTIRGMLRNVYETATDSCFSTLRPGTLMTARSNKKTEAGLLEYDEKSKKWTLYKATRYMLKKKRNDDPRDGKNRVVWDDKICPVYEVKHDKKGRPYVEYNGKQVQSGSEVYFVPLEVDRKTYWYIKTIKKKVNGEEYEKELRCAPVAKALVSANTPKAEPGVLVMGESIFNKHHESIFVKGEEVTAFCQQEKLKKAMAGMEETLKLYQNPAINRNLKAKDEKARHYGYQAYADMKKRGTIPVWYNEETGYFSLAAMGRIAYQKSLNDLVGKKQPCTKRGNLCEACSLFGMVGQEGEALGSRIRVSDARCLGEIEFKKDVILAALGQPRPSYLPFYAQWNLSHYRNSRSPIPPAGYDEAGVQIRGRKYYWHSGNFEEVNQNQEKTPYNNTMELAEAKSQFCFQVFFDRITKEELDKLIWSINFWENDKDGKLCHKIGHGRPIGLGSVKLVVDAVWQRNFSVEKGYVVSKLDIDYAGAEPVKDPENGFETIKELKLISTFDAERKTEYPYVKPKKARKDPEEQPQEEKANDLANHQWFTENKSSGLRGHNHPLQRLAKISEKQELKVYDAI